MAGITMCKNEECPSKKKCFRYTFSPSVYAQSYAIFVVPEGQKKCENFWYNGVKNNDNNRKSKARVS